MENVDVGFVEAIAQDKEVDFYRLVASGVFNKTEDDVSGAERTKVKHAMHLLIYGSVGATPEKGLQEFVDWCKGYPGMYSEA